MPTSLIVTGNGGQANYTKNQAEAFGSNTAFGEKLTANLEPAAIATFPYGLLEVNCVSGVMGSGTLGALSGMAVIGTGAAAASSGMVKTRRTMQYIPGEGGLLRLTCRFDTPASGCTQLIGYGDYQDGFFFGYNGLNFGVLKRRDGVDEWVYQEDWNENAYLNQDWQKLNIFQIRFQWLGAGAIDFSIEDPDSGTIRKVHTWHYTNRNLVPSILNPSLPAVASIENTTNTTNKQMHVICLAALREGIKRELNHLHGRANSKTGVTTETNIISIRNSLTFRGKPNRSMISIRLVGGACEGNKPSIVRLTRNAILGGTPSWTPNDNNSIIEVDVAGTTLTGGDRIMTMALGKSGNDRVAWDIDEIVLAPGEWATISVESSLATDASASITWHEDV